MSKSIIGKKIGMTQVFSENDKVVPVTAIDLNNWFVTNIKSKEKDGYEAVQVGLIRNKFEGQPFSVNWIKSPMHYFYALREVVMHENLKDAVVGQPVNFCSLLQVGEKYDVFGTTKGRGFQGVVKRHRFAGGPASHGPRLGRRPGSLGFMRSQGRVIKGKKLPGHMGDVQRVMRNLKVVRIESESNVVLVKGCIPGSSGSLIFMRKV